MPPMISFLLIPDEPIKQSGYRPVMHNDDFRSDLCLERASLERSTLARNARWNRHHSCCQTPPHEAGMKAEPRSIRPFREHNIAKNKI